MRLLPHLAAVCKRAREQARVGAAKVAGEVPYKASTSIDRTFERAHRWPKDADAVVNAYAQTTGVPALDLWRLAIERARHGAEGITASQLSKELDDSLRVAGEAVAKMETVIGRVKTPARSQTPSTDGPPLRSRRKPRRRA